MMASIQTSPLLNDCRGQTRADLDAIVDILTFISSLVFSSGSRISIPLRLTNAVRRLPMLGSSSGNRHAQTTRLLRDDDGLQHVDEQRPSRQRSSFASKGSPVTAASRQLHNARAWLLPANQAPCYGTLTRKCRNGSHAMPYGFAFSRGRHMPRALRWPHGIGAKAGQPVVNNRSPIKGRPVSARAPLCAGLTPAWDLDSAYNPSVAGDIGPMRRTVPAQ